MDSTNLHAHQVILLLSFYFRVDMAKPGREEGKSHISKFSKLIDSFNRIRLDNHQQHNASNQPSPNNHTLSNHPQRPHQPHPTTYHRTSYQRPAAQSKTWYAPQRLSVPQPIISPPDNSQGSPIRMPLPIPASRPPAPSSPPIHQPKPIAFPIPKPTGSQPQALMPLKPNHLRPPQASNQPLTPSGTSYSHQKPTSSEPFNCSNKLNLNLTQTPTQTDSNVSQYSHSNQKTPVTIDLTGSNSTKPIQTKFNASNAPTPNKKTSTTDYLSVSNPSTPNENAEKNHQNVVSNPSTPLKTPKKSSAHAFNSPSDSPTASPSSTGRCAGTTQQGKPCSRNPMKTVEGMAERFDELDEILLISSSACDDPFGSSPNNLPSNPLPHSKVPRFCFQHYKKTQSQTGAWFSNSQWVTFSDWIAPDLPEDVKIALKMEMSKLPTDKDRNERGYLYCHEMRPKINVGAGGGKGTYIKVGRSTRPVARLGEWMKQCPSREPIMRAIFPEPSRSDPTASSCYLNGAQTVSSQGIRFHRKWERLALLELAGHATVQRPGKNRKSPCIDCGKIHQELFELDLGSYELVVKPLIQNWQKWCSFAYL